ncbi:protein of unknown function [Candidatus Promineifilum breve]|uniref:Uncharacterized protein n=1 Tax=Candidatus Promineifilum breve TaxID=1806508 RepID=A0A160T7A5_9CHLR|nr:protein of unknown function [Candidatus Promineifilum breve]
MPATGQVARQTQRATVREPTNSIGNQAQISGTESMGSRKAGTEGTGQWLRRPGGHESVNTYRYT